jgi:hypothetical protein
MRRIGLILAILAGLYGTAAAQSGGQFCVKAFEDRNGNGVQDAGEPVLTRGISLNLLDAGGIVIQSGSLEASPRAAVGEFCFQFLAAGQYSLAITSTEYRATTPDTSTAAISETGAPTVVEYGGQRAIVAPTTSASAAVQLSPREQLAQIVVAGLGALLVIAIMAVLGLFIYWFGFRNRMQAAAATDARHKTTTGSMRAVSTTDTGEFSKE